MLWLAVPGGLAIVWLVMHQGLPFSDAGDNLRIAYLTYLAFHRGPAAGIDFTLHTGGKPFLFSLFAVPFMPLAAHNLLLPPQTFLISAAITLCLSCYWLFRSSLPPAQSAILAASILTVPTIFQTQLRFMSEVVWMLWFVLFLGFLLRSSGLSKIAETIMAGLFLALTLLARPIESTVTLVPGLTVYVVFHLARTGRIVALLVSSAICLALLAWASWINFYQSDLAFRGAVASIVGTVVLCALGWWAHRNAAKHPGVAHRPAAAAGPFLFLAPPTLLCGIWLSYYFSPLYYWAYVDSLGHYALVTDQANAGKSLIQIVRFVLNEYGSFNVLLLLAVAAAAAFILKGYWATRRWEAGIALAALTASTLPMILAYQYTGTSDPRRILMGLVLVLVLALFVTGVAARQSARTNLALNAGLIGIVILQAAAILGVTLRNPALIYPGPIGTLGVPTPQISPSYDADVVRKFAAAGVGTSRIAIFTLGLTTSPQMTRNYDQDLVGRFLALGVTKANIAVFTLGLFTDRVTYETESLRYAALLKDPSLNFRTCWAYANYENYSAVVQRMIRTGFDYVLFEGIPDPFADDPTMDTRMRPHTFFVGEVLQIIRSAGPEHLPGLRLIDRFKLVGRTSYIFAIDHPTTGRVGAPAGSGLCY